MVTICVQIYRYPNYNMCIQMIFIECLKANQNSTTEKVTYGGRHAAYK